MASAYKDIPVPTPTTKPVPSADIRDAVFAGAKLDEWSASSNESYRDRLGVDRLTANGMQVKFSAQMVSQALQFNTQINSQQTLFNAQMKRQDADWNSQMHQEDNDWRVQMESQRQAGIAQIEQQATDYYTVIQSSGYQVKGNYAAGLKIENYNELILAEGNFYRPSAGIQLPYTLTGDPAVDLANFYAVGDGKLRTEMALPTGGTLVGHSSGSTIDKLLMYVTPEAFYSGSGDHGGAIQNAIDYAIAHGIGSVIGHRKYKTSVPIRIAGAGVEGLNLRLYGLSATNDFMLSAATGGNVANLTLWNANPLIKIGDDSSNIANLNIHIDFIDGNHRADAVNNYGYGFSMSDIYLGYVTNCIRVVGSGNHIWPNASINWSGHTWTGNWIGLISENGKSGTTPIVEAWKIKVLFLYDNRYGGIWLRKSGQFTQISGDLDFNGRWTSRVRHSTDVNLSTLDQSKSVMLTNGTRTAEFLFRYEHQGEKWAVLAESRDALTNGCSFKAGEVLTAVGYDNVSVTVEATSVCGDNASQTNYWDIFHDFEGQPFAAVQIMCGYLSVVIGGLQYTSNIQFQNSFNRITNSMNGLAVGNSGSALSLYDLAHSTSPIMTADTKFVNWDRYQYTKLRRYVGEQYLVQVDKSTSVYTTVFDITDLSTDKISDEGTMVFVTLNSNYASKITFILGLKGNAGCTVNSPTETDGAFKFIIVQLYADDGVTPIGVRVKVRQEAQDTMRILANVVRWG